MLFTQHLKSYLPTHSILHDFIMLHLSTSADAIRAGCAEAKSEWIHSPMSAHAMQSVRDVLRQSYRMPPERYQSSDAIRAGCAETKAAADVTLA